jgi:PEP-CTERM motif
MTRRKNLIGALSIGAAVIAAAQIPEPPTTVLFFLGLAGLIGLAARSPLRSDVE